MYDCWSKFYLLFSIFVYFPPGLLFSIAGNMAVESAANEKCFWSGNISGRTIPQRPFTQQLQPIPPRQLNEMWKPGCPRREIYWQWCCRVFVWTMGPSKQPGKSNINAYQMHVWTRIPQRSLSHRRSGPHIPFEMVIKAMKLMKCGKAASTSLIVAEMLRAFRDERALQNCGDAGKDVCNTTRSRHDF